VREHNEVVNYLDLIIGQDEITVEYDPGAVEIVRQHDGSLLKLRKLANDYDVHDRAAALNYLHQREAAGEIVTGLLYVDPESEDLHRHMHTVDTPFNALTEEELIPGAAMLEKLNASLR
jgi:2-oxoglutarate ferredoxin oxidoreductase subunit beta